MNILTVIPARGGSKGIPRKNLRPLNGKPLIYYSIRLALNSSFKPDVYVSTDDSEIAYFAERYGAKVHLRNDSLSTDATTLDPVIYDAYSKISKELNKKYDLVITLQPTSPLLTVDSFDRAIQQMISSPGTETILSAVNDTHLTWGRRDNAFVPNYESRRNRQELPPVYKETGGFFISRSEVVLPASRIGSKVDLFLVPASEAIDIDSFEDWSLCEYYLKRKTILFNVSGYNQIGLGHVYNCLTLAHQILDHKIVFLVDDKSKLAFEKIKENNFEVHQQKEKELEQDILKLNPHLVINDRLDNPAAFIQNLKKANLKVVNIEDLGPGAKYADLVINAIYPETEKLDNHYFGPDYFCAREEFLLNEKKTINREVSQVLLSFGGVDPNNLTLKVLETIYDFCIGNGVKIKVVLGLGYLNEKSLERFTNAEILRNVQNISHLMYEADLVFSSAGRTLYELALVGTPSIVMAQNERELSHFFASAENGFENLGLGVNVSTQTLFDVFKTILQNPDRRNTMHSLMMKHNIRSGTKRVIQLIKGLLEEQESVH